MLNTNLINPCTKLIVSCTTLDINNFLCICTQLLRECKDVLLGGVLVKDYYLDLVEGITNSEDVSKESTDSDIEGFEQDLQSLLQVYVT